MAQREEIRVEGYASGKTPDWRILAMAFRDFDEMMRQNPEEEAKYQKWLAEYKAKKAG